MVDDVPYRSAAPGDMSAELRRLVRRWRRDLDPDEWPGFSAYPTRHRKRVSQDDVATRIGVTTSWYGELERGVRGRYSDDLLNRVANVLKLNPAERELLFLEAVGRLPPPMHTFSAEVSETTKTIVDAQAIPAYISDVAWDVKYWNQHVTDWFPWLPAEPNVMRWVFTYPEARMQLADWSTVWAPRMVAQMRFVQARFSDNRRLSALIEEIKELNPDARRMFEQDVLVLSHPDGDRRELYVPHRRDPVPIVIRAFAPLEDLTQRMIMLVPLSSDAKPGIKIHRARGDSNIYPAGPGSDPSE